MTRDPVYGCELWQGKLDKDGYGRDGRRQAHVVAYERAYGPLEEGKFLDHLCRRRHCAALAHLEPVDRRENERRKRWRYRVRRKVCSEGHDLARCGRVTPEGGKVCRICSGV